MKSLLTGVDNALHTKLNRSDEAVPGKNEMPTVQQTVFSLVFVHAAFIVKISSYNFPSLTDTWRSVTANMMQGLTPAQSNPRVHRQRCANRGAGPITDGR